MAAAGYECPVCGGSGYGAAAVVVLALTGAVAPRLAHSRCLPPGASAWWRLGDEEVDWVSIDALVTEDAGLMARQCEAEGDPVSAAGWRSLP